MAANQFVVSAVFRAKDELSGKLQKMQGGAAGFAKKFQDAGKTAFSVGRKAAITTAIIAAPLVVAAKSAIDFEERLTDISKTTGLSGKELDKFGQGLRDMSKGTRTSLDDLATIGEIGGQLGIPKEQLLDFTAAANKFSIALGGDFSGGVEEAVSSISKVKTLFKDTRGLDISTAISKTGSAINELGAVGNGTSANITDFAQRMGALDDTLKGSATSTLAIGAYLEEMGIDSQIASSGLSNLIVKAAGNLPGFAKQMKISAKEAETLFSQDPNQFIASFAQSLKGMSAPEIAKTLGTLELGSLEMKKVLGALSSDSKDAATGLTRLNTLQNLSAKAFSENTSLTDEAAKKEATRAAQLDRLKNNLQDLAITVGDTLLPVITSLVNSVTPFVQSISKWMQRNKGLTSTIAKLAVKAVALGGAVTAVSYAVGVFQKGMVLASGAAKLFATGPMGLIVLGLSAVALAIKGVVDYNAAFKTSQELANEVSAEAFSQTRDQRIELKQHFDTLRKAKEGSDAYKNALSAINQIAPGVTEKYNLQTKSLSALNAAEKESISLIMARAKAEIAAEKAKEALRNADRVRTEGLSLSESIGAAFSGIANGEIFQKSAADFAIEATQKVARGYDAQARKGYEMSNAYSKQADQITQSPADPQVAQQQNWIGNLKQMVTVNITGLPAGVTAEQTGGPSNTRLPFMPKSN